MNSLLNALCQLRTVLVSIPLIYLATIFWGTASLLLSPMDAQGARQHGCARWWSRTLLFVCGVRVRVRGLGHIPKGQSCVFAANHQSYLDIPVVFGWLPVNFRIMAKASLFHIPFLGWHLRRSGHMPIHRDNPRRAARSLLEAAGHVREGTPVFVFPEGGRSRDGRLGEFKAGTFLLAIKAGVPVVPMTIRGTREALPMNSWNIRAADVELILHEPIPAEAMRAGRAEELAARVRAVIASGLESHD
jgi:1-acyl-sn-glycerol-3-phosphate acyltransferase